MKHEAFDGAVIFEMTYPTLRAEIVKENYQRAFPEWAQWQETKGWLYEAWLTCALCLPRTRSIQVNTDNEELQGLKAFWELAQGSDDPVAVFDACQRLLGVNVYRAWWEAYVQAMRASDLLAPPEMATEQPEDEALKKSAAPS